MTKKILAALFLPLLVVSFLSAQSLAELSKKEKERRAALKGKHGPVVTNEDLGKMKKKPAVTTVEPAKTGEETQAENPEDPAETATPPGEAATDSPGGADAVRAGPRPIRNRPSPISRFNATKTELEDQWNRAQEMVDLLTMKMNALWQQFYSMDDMERGTRSSSRSARPTTSCSEPRKKSSRLRTEEGSNEILVLRHERLKEESDLRPSAIRPLTGNR